ncbi:TenA family transcriptional regulator [Streptomyces lunaelactis]|uniref:TenA family transcriptional regulator n=1 Tax=Streptomyces lunaelactis TaxID=1535768 RepID=A0A2R4TBC9_9ACTN|nr:TenA family transcriptional regulator [Streptomyces lunaelactis]AVZ76428.1 TenA family transcriptional regulator [Streptomyces lunaelactis]NUK00663.1 TenA family transcriptional regulator [Streptomyces lunaelactis]NUK06615.1 TenA family transcriptional regulator [Streptomyces lunaelactis]NUK14383.1 TenA family transcriptional regulator [Streptomyces lunaelactis]NUK21452.1 TenA family transcriptional regulator [Streptomyces lunaelactis]
MLQEELKELAAPILDKVRAHPFWSGLRDGSLPGESLAHFVEQDTGYLLPSYARGLARAAAAARGDEYTALLGRSITGTLEARDKLREAYGSLAGELGTPALDPEAAVDPAAHAHSSFFQAATATSFAAGFGALLPMVWFNYQVSNDLLERHTSGSRYAPWIEIYHPGEGYGYAVKAFMGVADRLGEELSGAERAELVDHFAISTRYEWAFAEAAWSRPSWPF